MFRVLLILGVLVLVPAAIVFWRTRDRTPVVPSPAGLPSQTVGTSTIGHGGPVSPVRSVTPTTNGIPESEVPERNP